MQNLFAQVLYLAAEDEPEGIDLILPATEELIAGVIAFAIVFLGFWFLVRPRMSTMLAARQQAITGKLEEAEKAKGEAESLLEDYKAQLAEARVQAGSIVDEARQQAETVRSEIVSRAEAEAAETVSKAREEAASERERAAGAMRDEVASLSLAIAKKVVGDSVDEKTQRSLVDRYIDELEDLG
jgi:F-type H+-transporting ATPase subunit b